MTGSGSRPHPPPEMVTPRYRFVWPLLGLLACLAGLAAAVAGIFTVRQVVVVGNNVPGAAIAQEADVVGRNIFTVRSDAVVARFGGMPQIVVQRVQPSFPDSVTIYARERIAMVAWQQPGGGLFLVDPDGHIITQVKATRLPVITGTAPGTELGPGIVTAVRSAVQLLPTEPNGAISGFRLAPGTGLTIAGKTGWTADIGRGDPQTLINRIATLAGFLASIRDRQQPLKFIDLRYRVPYATFGGG